MPIMLSGEPRSSSETSSADSETNGEITDDTPSPPVVPNRPPNLSGYPLIPRSQLEVQDQLGFGSYGSVFKAKWNISDEKSLTVALKKVFMLEKEVDILSQIRHRNIIQFFGVSQTDSDFFIVTEYAQGGSLYEYLHNANAEMSCERILRWATQIAHGVAYLHYEAPTTIIHRDLKSKNVVIGQKMTCKLIDFGTSKDLTHSWTAPTWGGTAAWMSPEMISQREGITPATDVWSYGVVLWELFTREIPYKGLTEFKIYSIISQQGAKLVIPEKCPMHLAKLLHACWHTNPKDRVEMREVVACLEHMKDDKQIKNECAHFVKQKDEWEWKIQEQLEKFNALKLDIARQIEELQQREQALRRREDSHRNFLHMLDFMRWNPIEWSEDCVCEWVQHIWTQYNSNTVVDGKGEEFIDEAVLNRIISSVLEKKICGKRLLKITERDLENLGVTSARLRRYVLAQIDELRARSLDDFDMIGFPTLELASEIEARKKQDKSKRPFDCPISLHIGMYTRRVVSVEVAGGVVSSSAVHRFKVFMDTDWQSRELAEPLAPDIIDSANVIKEVSFSMSTMSGDDGGNNDARVILDNVRCTSPPFGYLQWTEVSESQLPIELTLCVTYADHVVQPRSTRITLRLDDVSQPKTLCEKLVSLRVHPLAAMSASISRISSFFNNCGGVAAAVAERKSSSPAANNDVWRGRCRSFGTSGNTLSPATAAGKLRSSRSTVWSGIVATLRKKQLEATIANQFPRPETAALPKSGGDESPPPANNHAEGRPFQLGSNEGISFFVEPDSPQSSMDSRSLEMSPRRDQ